MRRTRPRQQWSILNYLMAQRCPEADHPVQGKFMDLIREHAEANSTREVADYFLAEARRRTIIARDHHPVIRDVRDKRARRAARLKAQGLEVVDG